MAATAYEKRRGAKWHKNQHQRSVNDCCVVSRNIALAYAVCNSSSVMPLWLRCDRLMEIRCVCSTTSIENQLAAWRNDVAYGGISVFVTVVRHGAYIISKSVAKSETAAAWRSAYQS